MPPTFKRVKDGRTPQCEHDQNDGCMHCCLACDYDKHTCGECGDSMTHISCSGRSLGWCDKCRAEHARQIGS